MGKANGRKKAQAPAPAPQQQQQRDRPVHEVRRGNIRASIWLNHHAEKGEWFNVTTSRAYKDAQGNWKNATSYGKDDLLALGEVSRLAYHWIELEQQRRFLESRQQQQHERQPGEDDLEPHAEEPIPF